MRGEVRDARLATATAENFNPLAPCGARSPRFDLHKGGDGKFQSTRPMRGEVKNG